MKIGFIGTGRMGQAMAGRVLGAGHELFAYNRTPERAAALGQRGARVVASIAEACAGRDVVITMLADDAALEEVSLGDGGLVASLPEGRIHLAMGTHGVAMIRKLAGAHAKAGRILVAAPVLGRPDAAAAGQLGVVSAGPPDAVAFCRPLFEAVGRRTFAAGSKPEAAAAIKITNNFVLGCAIEAMGEAFALVEKFGVAPSVMYDVLTDALFAAPGYKVYGKIIVDESYDRVGQSALLGFKDAELALAAAAAARVPLPSVNVWRDRLLGAIAHGDGGKDWAVMALEQARASGLR
jgi:3-hydroxyisobutyrate dehydrogenase-like beta-hydroxyacid dehydrogenase